MITRLLLLGILLTVTISASAAERFSLKIDLAQGEKVVERGRALVSQKQRTWSKGLQRSYLKLRCKQLESGKTEKLLSTVDHFDGFRVTHQLAENEVVLTVVRTIVQPRLTEIRALAKNECKDLSPIVTTTTLSFTLPAVDGNTESRPFGENMIFRATLQSLDINR